MNCRDLEELLSAYADGELPRTPKEFIDEHLAGCPECRATLADFAAAGRLLASLGAVPAAPDMRQATLTKIKAQNTLHKSTLSYWLRPALATGAVLTALVALLITQPWTPRTPAVSAADIVRGSPQVQTFLDGEKILDVVTTRVIGSEGGVLVVLVKTESRTAAAEVDLDRKIVTEIVRVNARELSSEDNQKAVDIVRTAPEVQDLLARGAIIGKPAIDYAISIEEATGADGKVIREGSARVIGRVPVADYGGTWLVTVDIDSGTVLYLDKPPAPQEAGKSQSSAWLVAGIGIFVIVSVMAYFWRDRIKRILRGSFKFY